MYTELEKNFLINYMLEDTDLIYNYLKEDFEIFDDDEIQIYDAIEICNYSYYNYYENFNQHGKIDFSNSFDYISKVSIENSFLGDLDGNINLESNINNLRIKLSISSINHYSSEIILNIQIAGNGTDFAAFNDRPIIINFKVEGKLKNNDIPVWQEYLYSFYNSYVNGNYRSAYINLFIAFESFISLHCTNPKAKIRQKLENIIGNLKKHSKTYRDNFFKHRDLRNELFHNNESEVSKIDVIDLFMLFIITEDKIKQSISSK